MNKSMKPAGFAPRVAPAKPLTEEEKKVKIMQFLQQKRESFSLNILCNLIQGTASNTELEKESCLAIVDLSVDMADHLMDKLYPVEDNSNN